MKYSYPAIFTKEGTAYSVLFPDLDGCYTCGDNLDDALYMAKDVLAFTLYSYEKRHQAIPVPSSKPTVKAAQNEIVLLVSCDTSEYCARGIASAPASHISELPVKVCKVPRHNSRSLKRFGKKNIAKSKQSRRIESKREISG